MQQVLKSVSGPAFRGGMLSLGMDSLGELFHMHSTQIFYRTSPVEISKFDYETGQFHELETSEPNRLDTDEIKPAFVMVTNGFKRLKLNYSPQNLDSPSFTDEPIIKTQILYGHNSEIVKNNQLLTPSDFNNEGPINLMYSYQGCCWFDLQPDNRNMTEVTVPNNSSNDGEPDSMKNLSKDFQNRDLNFLMTGFMKSLNNPSPRMIVPSQWFVNAGCDSSLKLFPFISNKNLIKCRWANYQEALGGAYDPNIWPSISLTEDCLLTYNASKEMIQVH